MSESSRLVYLESVFKDNLLNLIQSENGISSIIYVCENELTYIEKVLIIEKMKVYINEDPFNLKLIRLSECLVGCFPFHLVKFIIDFSLFNFSKYLSIREGYFLLRIIIKSIKDEDYQKQIVKIISSNFLENSKNSNGSLLFQCMIYNFPKDKFTYKRSCKGNSKEDKEDEFNYDQKNKAIYRLIGYLLKYIDEWTHYLIKPIIECAIKISYSSFEAKFTKLIQENISVLESIISLSKGVDIIRYILLNFTNENTLERIISYIRKNIDFVPKKESIHFHNLFERYYNYYKADKRSKYSTEMSSNENIISVMPKNKTNSNDLKYKNTSIFNPSVNYYPLQPQPLLIPYYMPRLGNMPLIYNIQIINQGMQFHNGFYYN